MGSRVLLSLTKGRVVELLEYLMAVVLAYVAGSIPLSRLVQLNSLPKFRGKPRLHALVKVSIDIFKGYAVVSAAHKLSGDCALIVTLSVFLGHIYPIFPKFSGGNGLGTALGALIALDPTIGLTGLAAWTFGYYVFQQAQVAALISATAVPLAAGFFALPFSALPLCPMAVIIFWRNREKIVMVFIAPKAKELRHDV
jgi:acyl-phosphate glycerol 3-phosphate acyltransferase